jgi:hypothetical protein
MRSSSLRDLSVRLGLDSVDKVWELDSILNEENWDIVSNNVCDMSAHVLRVK